MFSVPVGPPQGLPRMDSTYGLAVYATAFPSFVEFFEALETGVGAGTYGSFVSVDKLASVQGDWTICTRRAPNDGLRRQMKAQHVRDGATSSAFTSVVTVAPWGTPARNPLPPAYRLIPYEDTYYASTADASGQVFLNGAGVSSTQKVNVGTPTTPATMQRIYRIPGAAFTADHGTATTGWDKQNGYLVPTIAGTGITMLAPVILPQGSTAISLVLRAKKTNHPADSVGATFFRANDDAALTTIGSCTLTATGAWTTVTSTSFSEAINTSYLYFISVNLFGNAAGSDAKLSYVELTVTVPDINTGL